MSTLWKAASREESVLYALRASRQGREVPKMWNDDEGTKVLYFMWRTAATLKAMGTGPHDVGFMKWAVLCSRVGSGTHRACMLKSGMSSQRCDLGLNRLHCGVFKS